MSCMYDDILINSNLSKSIQSLEHHIEKMSFVPGIRYNYIKKLHCFGYNFSNLSFNSVLPSDNVKVNFKIKASDWL